MRRGRAQLGLAAGFLFAASAAAHPLGPSLLELVESANGTVEVVWKKPAAAVPGAIYRPVLEAPCRPIGEPTVSVEEMALVERWTEDCAPQGLAGRRIGIDALETSRAPALARVVLADGTTRQRVLTPEKPFVEINVPSSAAGVFGDYLRLGFAHILGGFDHLLFVLGLVLLVAGRRLLVTVTAFTVGHSVTLALAVLGFVHVPQATAEAAIATTILALAVELARRPDARPGLLRRYPPGMAALFGLLHGLGFAGALAEIGLPAGEIPLSLFSFNVGIEIGQLAFIVVVMALGRVTAPVVRRLPGLARLAPAYTIGSLAAYWLIDRLG